MDMQKECKIRKDRELIKFFEISAILSESAVPESSKTRRYFGINCSGSILGSEMNVLISGGYKISTLFAKRLKRRWICVDRDEFVFLRIHQH